MKYLLIILLSLVAQLSFCQEDPGENETAEAHKLWHYANYDFYDYSASDRKKMVLQAVEKYKKAAELGCYHAMANYGECYEFGYGNLNKDFEQAVIWYRKSAILGSPKGQWRFGRCLYRGLGIISYTSLP